MERVDNDSYVPSYAEVKDDLPDSTSKPYKSRDVHRCAVGYRNISADNIMTECDWRGNWTAKPPACEREFCPQSPDT